VDVPYARTTGANVKWARGGGLTVGDREFADSSLEGTGFEPSGPSLEQIVCLASRMVAIGEKIGEPDGRKAFAKSC
jgi:hypothetical protein